MVTLRPASDANDADSEFASPIRSHRRRSVFGVIGVFAAVCGWVLWRTGPATVGYLDFFERNAATWPHGVLAPENQYVLRVPLGQVVYRLLPEHSIPIYLTLNVVCLVIAGAVLGVWLCRRLGVQAGFVAASVVVLAPVTAVLLLLIGIYDAFSVLAWIAVLIALGRSGRWQLAAGALAGIQDFEQISVGVAMVLLIPALSRAAGLCPRARPLLAGLILGRVLLEGYLHAIGVGSGSRLSYVAHWDVLSFLLGSATAGGPLIVWSALAGLWGFALTALLRSWGGWPSGERRNFVLAAGLWAGACALSADHTRVLALTSFPLVVMGAMIIALHWPDWRALARLPQTWMLVLAPPVVIGGLDALTMGIKLGTWGIGIF